MIFVALLSQQSRHAQKANCQKVDIMIKRVRFNVFFNALKLLLILKRVFKSRQVYSFTLSKRRIRS